MRNIIVSAQALKTVMTPQVEGDDQPYKTTKFLIPAAANFPSGDIFIYGTPTKDTSVSKTRNIPFDIVESEEQTAAISKLLQPLVGTNSAFPGAGVAALSHDESGNVILELRGEAFEKEAIQTLLNENENFVLGVIQSSPETSNIAKNGTPIKVTSIHRVFFYPHVEDTVIQPI